MPDRSYSGENCSARQRAVRDFLFSIGGFEFKPAVSITVEKLPVPARRERHPTVGDSGLTALLTPSVCVWNDRFSKRPGPSITLPIGRLYWTRTERLSYRGRGGGSRVGQFLPGAVHPWKYRAQAGQECRQMKLHRDFDSARSARQSVNSRRSKRSSNGLHSSGAEPSCRLLGSFCLRNGLKGPERTFYSC